MTLLIRSSFEALCKIYLYAVLITILGCYDVSERGDRALTPLSTAERRVLKNILINVYDKDQEYRAQAIAAINQYGLRSEQVRTLAEKINDIDSVNLRVVKSIIEKYGWLGSDVVGEKANSALYLVIQHSDEDDRAFFLPIMRKAVENSSAKKQDLAYLEDRVADDQGRKQLYGTQVGFDETTEKYYLLPLEDLENVDARRAEMGLIPLKDYLSQWRIQFQ